MIQIGFETKDARKLRAYLAEKGVAVPAKVGKDLDGNYSFAVKDPEGHQVEFVEYTKGSLHSRNFGKAMTDKRISDHMLHVGIHVKNSDVQDKFYKDILGFRFQWKGGPLDTQVDWMSYMVPDGNNWVEYMISRGTPSPAQLGVWHHVCIGTLDIQALYKTVVSRGYTPRREPNIARDGRWLLQLYDKHNTRTEVMIRKPVEKPCCSENLDPYNK
jgi:Glyoxalase/Bleomycin resistance protein/Dioxygenase superfamily